MAQEVMSCDMFNDEVNKETRNWQVLIKNNLEIFSLT